MARPTEQYIESFHFDLLPHPPNSPDLAPSDVYLFSLMKEAFQGLNESDDNEVPSGAIGTDQGPTNIILLQRN